MPSKFISTKKRENWDCEADRELKRRGKAAEKITAAETRKRERDEAAKWRREIGKEKTCREKIAAAEMRKREYKEFLKMSKEITEEKNRRKCVDEKKERDAENLYQKQGDVEEAPGWHGSKKFGKIRRSFRRKFERRKPSSFKVVRTYSNANAKLTTYFDTYKTYVYGRVDPVAVFKKALDMTVEERQLVPGGGVRVVVSHPSWAEPFSTKLITITHDEQFFYILLKTVLEYVDYKAVPLDEVTVEVQSTKIPLGTGRSIKITSDNSDHKRCIITIKNFDTMCLARAIVTAHVNINKTKWTKSQVKNGFNASRELQGTEAWKLHKETGIPVTG